MCHLCVKKQQKKSKHDHAKNCRCERCRKGYHSHSKPVCCPEPCCPPKPVCCPPKPVCCPVPNSYCAPEPCCPVPSNCCPVPTPAPVEPVKAYGSVYELSGPVGLDDLSGSPGGYRIDVGPTGTLYISPTGIQGYLGATGDIVLGKQLPLVQGDSSLFNTLAASGGLKVNPGGDITLQYDVTIPNRNLNLEYSSNTPPQSVEGYLRIASILAYKDGKSVYAIEGSARLISITDFTFTAGSTSGTASVVIEGLDHTSAVVLQQFPAGSTFYVILLAAVVNDTAGVTLIADGDPLVFSGLPDLDASASLTATLERQILSATL